MKNILNYLFFIVSVMAKSSFATHADLNDDVIFAGSGLMQLRGIYDFKEIHYESQIKKTPMPVLIIPSRELMIAKGELIPSNDNLQSLKRPAPSKTQGAAKRKRCALEKIKPLISLDQKNSNVTEQYENAISELNDLSGKKIPFRQCFPENKKIDKLWDNNKYLNSIIKICYIEQNYPELFENRNRKILVHEGYLNNKSDYRYFNPYIVRKYWWQFLSEEIKSKYRTSEEERIKAMKSIKKANPCLPDPEDVNDPDFEQYVRSASDYGRAVKVRITHVVEGLLRKPT